MSTISVSFPESLRQGIEALVCKDGYSFDQFLASAAAEKLSVLQTQDYLQMRAQRADLAEFDRLLDMVPDVEPEPHDRLP